MAVKLLPSLLGAMLPVHLAAVTLTVGRATGNVNDTVMLTVRADDSSRIVAASFALTYDPTGLELVQASSRYFDTFASQFAGLVPTPPTVVSVAGTLYTQPLVMSPTPAGTLLSALRRRAGSGPAVLFTLHFRIKREGVFPVGIQPATLTCTAAGYPSAGETVPILAAAVAAGADLIATAIETAIVPGAVGAPALDQDDDGMSDPWEDEFLAGQDQAPDADADADGVTNLDEFLHRTHPTQLDTDGDGIPDRWEIEHGLNPVDASGLNGAAADPDGDGYTNLEEYLGNSDPMDPMHLPSVAEWLFRLNVASGAAGGAEDFAALPPLVFGMRQGASDAFDPGIDQAGVIPVPGDVEVQFQDPISFFPLVRDIRAMSDDALWQLYVRIPSGRAVRIAWDVAALPPHVALMALETDENWQAAGAPIDVAAGQWYLANSGPSDLYRHWLVYATLPEPVLFPFRLAGRRWHLLSLPILPDSAQLRDLLPGSVIAWEFNRATGGYVPTIRVRPGIGYWVWLSADVDTQIRGRPLLDQAANLGLGWNLVGPTGNRNLPRPLNLIVYGWEPTRRIYLAPRVDCELGKGYFIWADAPVRIWSPD